MTEPTRPPNPTLAHTIADMGQQLTLLALTLGCALKATAHRDKAKAQAIEANLQLLLSVQDTESWQPRAKQLIDLMYSALAERGDDE